MEKYFIVREHDIDEFIKKVNEYLQQGYELFGYTKIMLSEEGELFYQAFRKILNNL